MAVTRIARVSFTTALPETLAHFYCDALGFEQIGAPQQRDDAFSYLLGLSRTKAHVTALRLGRQTLELVAFDSPGTPYPGEIVGNDLRFQHIAIAVSDMSAAYRHLRQFGGWHPITRFRPQRLPATSGGVTAFKFRDPEGHPLELLSFPRAERPPAWQLREPRSPFLGIDHSAISVANSARSIAFYERHLGFRVGSRSLNAGPEQQRLDNLPDPIVEVTSLLPASEEPPHLELLCYRRPRLTTYPPQCLASNDVASSRLVLDVDPGTNLRAFRLDRHDIRGGTGLRASGNGSEFLRDCDGHALMLNGSRALSVD